MKHNLKAVCDWGAGALFGLFTLWTLLPFFDFFFWMRGEGWAPNGIGWMFGGDW